VTDEELLRRLMHDADEEAFRALYSRHSAPVYGLLCGLAGRTPDASHLLQETWLHAMRHLSLFRGQCAFRTWLGEIALNCHRERCRRHPRDASLDDLAPVHPSIGDPAADDPARLIRPSVRVAPRAADEERLVTVLRDRGLLRPRRRASGLLWIAATVVLIGLVLALWRTAG
jgi:DNA-directed RNA polymerase specialized sigma24 family protein